MGRVFIAAFALALLFPHHLDAQAPKRPQPKTPAKKVVAPPPEPPPPPPPPPPDLKVSARYTTGEKITRSTTLFHAARQRIDYESELAAIQQCDAGRAVQVNTNTGTYLEMPFTPATPAAVADAPSAKRKGGMIVYTTTTTDTNERKDLFGFPARRLKTVITKEPSPEACDKSPEKVEVDGWYIDLPPTVTCMGAPPPLSEVRADPKDASCRDSVTFVGRGSQAPYPLSYTMVTTAGGDAAVTTTMEVTELQRVAADPQQFDVPADYVPVKSVVQLAADHRPGEVGPKKPGVARVGVAPVANRTNQQISTTDLAQALTESLGEVAPDVVLLRGDTPAAIEADAKARSCDYILQNTVAEVKMPGKSMLGKLSGTSADAYSAKVDFALVAPGEAKPAFAGSGRSGTSMLQTAVGAAKRVSQYFPPFMMTRGYMGAFSNMSGATSPGAMQQTQDPVLSTVFALVDRATGPKPQETLTSSDGAVAAAMQREVEAVAAQLNRKKP